MFVGTKAVLCCFPSHVVFAKTTEFLIVGGPPSFLETYTLDTREKREETQQLVPSPRANFQTFNDNEDRACHGPQS